MAVAKISSQQELDELLNRNSEYLSSVYSLIARGLKTLPSFISKLQSLNVLNLYGNGLDSVPPELGDLQSLSHLNLGRNNLRFLPPEIGNLRSLGQLNLSDNKLISLPREIGKLQSLKGLNISGNPCDTGLPHWGICGEICGFYLEVLLLRLNDRLPTMNTKQKVFDALYWNADRSTMEGSLRRYPFSGVVGLRQCY